VGRGCAAKLSSQRRQVGGQNSEGELKCAYHRWISLEFAELRFCGYVYSFLRCK